MSAHVRSEWLTETEIIGVFSFTEVQYPWPDAHLMHRHGDAGQNSNMKTSRKSLTKRGEVF
jgi:hypothetical protein